MKRRKTLSNRAIERLLAQDGFPTVPVFTVDGLCRIWKPGYDVFNIIERDHIALSVELYLEERGLSFDTDEEATDHARRHGWAFTEHERAEANGVRFTGTLESAEDYLLRTMGDRLTPIEKGNSETRAWYGEWEGSPIFIKFYPGLLYRSRALTEMAIASGLFHPAIIPLRHVVQCQDGPLFLYDQVDGETLGTKEARERFYALPLAEKLTALNTIFSALAAVTEAGYVLVDMDEGNLVYDYERKQVWLFDWDLCRKGNGFALAMDRNYGSSRLMAPEEFHRGEWIDQRTNVFNLGRLATLTLGDDGPWSPILAQATDPTRLHRHATVREFADAFAAAVSDGIV